MHVAHLYRYPVKGLSAEPLASVQLDAGGIFPFDRCLAFLRTQSDFDADAPHWLPKANFLMLMLHERLAELHTRFDPERRLLIVESTTGTRRFAIDDPDARRELEAFLERTAGSRAGAPRLVEAPAHHFMDKADRVISLINLASIDDLARRLRKPVDPLRFRANIYISGAPTWAELDWVGRELRIGNTLFRVDRRNGRCAATNVNPSTAARDLDIPGTLRQHFGHKDCGVYLVVTRAGCVRTGDGVEVAAPLAPAASPAPTASPAPAARPAPVLAASEAWMCRACYLVVPAARFASAAASATRPPRPLLPPADWKCPDCGAGATLLERAQPVF